MPIEQTFSLDNPRRLICTTFTGAGIDAFKLASWRGMLKLELLGMRTRTGALRPKLAKALGLSARAPYEAYLEAVEQKLQEAKDAVTAEHTQQGRS